MSYLRYLCLLAHNDVQLILCFAFVFFFLFVLLLLPLDSPFSIALSESLHYFDALYEREIGR
jgi:hypothetical protein